MTLKASFANVLRALRNKRNISQRDFADTTSRTYLSKLELGKSSVTLDKLDQISHRLQLSPLTLLTLTLSENTNQSAAALISKLQVELAELQHDEGLPGLKMTQAYSDDHCALGQLPRELCRTRRAQSSMQTELAFSD